MIQKPEAKLQLNLERRKKNTTSCFQVAFHSSGVESGSLTICLTPLPQTVSFYLIVQLLDPMPVSRSNIRPLGDEEQASMYSGKTPRYAEQNVSINQRQEKQPHKHKENYAHSKIYSLLRKVESQMKERAKEKKKLTYLRGRDFQDSGCNPHHPILQGDHQDLAYCTAQVLTPASEYNNNTQHYTFLNILLN